MKTFIANFGRENNLWPKCRDNSSVATFEDEDLRPLWIAGDREAYIERCIRTKLTAAGIAPTKPVASRWFNLAQIISSTDGDLWIHREKDELWWTVSRAGEVHVTLEPAFKPTSPDQRVYVLQKPAGAWSNKTRSGTPLDWKALHPKAREFLFTEATLQQLRDDNADYAFALISGDDLGAWHSRPEWKLKVDAVRRSPVTTFDAKRRTAVRMAMTARETVASANGQQVLQKVKEKNLGFGSQGELEAYIGALLDAQEGLCAITGLQLLLDGVDGDSALRCSLDRIDSNGHYEPGNLQIVCQFVNKWKGAENDSEFRRLLKVVRSVDNIDG